MNRKLALLGGMGGGLVAGVVIGASLLGATILPSASETPVSQATVVPADGVVPGSTGENAAGQTFGPATDAAFTDGPDLIEALATNGLIGYVSATALADATGPAPSLAEALASKSEPIELPVYLADGKTEIGVFLVEPPVVVETGE